jgi:hypothetical protein
MTRFVVVVVLIAGTGFSGPGIVGAGFSRPFLSAQQLPNEPFRQFGTSVTGAFEGWFPNTDGSRLFLIGYLNRNNNQSIDIPIGPNNHIDPGGPDMGQPTHFLPGRQWGMFTVPAPKEFKPTDSYVWTIVANGQTTSIPLRLHPDYVMSPFTEIAVGNTPPVIRFEQGGSARVQGPQANIATAPIRTAALATPLPLTIWVTDDLKYTSGSSAPPSASRNPVTLSFSKYRGPGAVTFDKAKPTVEKLPGGEAATVPFGGRATTTVKFSEAGDYVLHVIANDYSGDGGGGFGCCWSTALLKVAVK